MSTPSIDNRVRYRIQQRNGEAWVAYRCGQQFRLRSSANRQAARIGARVGEHNIRVVAVDRDTGLPL